MTIAIYSIQNKINGKRYIGKSKNVKLRFYNHKCKLCSPVRHKDTNRHLYNSVTKYGIESFKFEIIEEFQIADDVILTERELYWMDFYKTCNREYGYNLRRDSSGGMEVSIETRLMKSEMQTGESNSNFGNYWDMEQREHMSKRMLESHKTSDSFGDEWKAKIGAKSTKTWSDLEKRAEMADKVKKTKQLKNCFHQFDRNLKLIRIWDTLEEIITENPTYKWQNIYSCCNGYKPTYMGFKWKKVPKTL